MLSTSSVKETDVEKVQYYYLVVCDGMYINGPSAGLWKKKKKQPKKKQSVCVPYMFRFIENL